MKSRFVSVKKIFLAKKGKNYASFVLKFGTKKKIFYNYANNLCL